MKIGGYEVQVPFVTTSSDSLKTILEFADYKKSNKRHSAPLLRGSPLRGLDPESSWIPHRVRDDEVHEDVSKIISEHDRIPSAIDLGSGDGRVALELAKHGFMVTGIEHSEALVTRSKERAVSLGLDKKTNFEITDFWQINLKDFDVIYIYGMGSIMGRLEKKLDEEMQSGARFISNVFTLPHWKVKKTKNNVNLYLKQ